MTEELFEDTTSEINGDNENEFQFYLSFTKPLVLNLPTLEDRILAAAWIKKLMACPTDDEVKLKYLKLMLFLLQRGKLSGVFLEDPNKIVELVDFPEFNLVDVARKMLENDIVEKIMESGDSCPEIITDFSSDLSEYVALQKIPNFGIHAYYAISKEPLTMWNRPEKALFPKTTCSMIKLIEEPDSAPLEASTTVINRLRRRTDKMTLGGMPTCEPLGKVEGVNERVPPTWGSNLVEVKERLNDLTAENEEEGAACEMAAALKDFQQTIQDAQRAHMTKDATGLGGRGAGPPNDPVLSQLLDTAKVLDDEDNLDKVDPMFAQFLDGEKFFTAERPKERPAEEIISEAKKEMMKSKKVLDNRTSQKQERGGEGGKGEKMKTIPSETIDLAGNRNINEVKDTIGKIRDYPTTVGGLLGSTPKFSPAPRMGAQLGKKYDPKRKTLLPFETGPDVPSTSFSPRAPQPSVSKGPTCPSKPTKPVDKFSDPKMAQLCMNIEDIYKNVKDINRMMKPPAGVIKTEGKRAGCGSCQLDYDDEECPCQTYNLEGPDSGCPCEAKPVFEPPPVKVWGWDTPYQPQAFHSEQPPPFGAITKKIKKNLKKIQKNLGTTQPGGTVSAKPSMDGGRSGTDPCTSETTCYSREYETTFPLGGGSAMRGGSCSTIQRQSVNYAILQYLKKHPVRKLDIDQWQIMVHKAGNGGRMNVFKRAIDYYNDLDKKYGPVAKDNISVDEDDDDSEDEIDEGIVELYNFLQQFPSNECIVENRTIDLSVEIPRIRGGKTPPVTPENSDFEEYDGDTTETMRRNMHYMDQVRREANEHDAYIDNMMNQIGYRSTNGPSPSRSGSHQNSGHPRRVIKQYDIRRGRTQYETEMTDVLDQIGMSYVDLPFVESSNDDEYSDETSQYMREYKEISSPKSIIQRRRSPVNINNNSIPKFIEDDTPIDIDKVIYKRDLKRKTFEQMEGNYTEQQPTRYLYKDYSFEQDSSDQEEYLPNEQPGPSTAPMPVRRRLIQEPYQIVAGRPYSPRPFSPQRKRLQRSESPRRFQYGSSPMASELVYLDSYIDNPPITIATSTPKRQSYSPKRCLPNETKHNSLDSRYTTMMKGLNVKSQRSPIRSPQKSPQRGPIKTMNNEEEFSYMNRPRRIEIRERDYTELVDTMKEREWNTL